MTVTGGCRCGAIRYEAEGAPAHHALCHCERCRRSSGAWTVGWALFPREAVTITGTPSVHNSSGDAYRHFCGTCGTGLFYVSESVFPGQIDIQTGSFDDPDAIPPQVRIQLADAPRWMERFGELPSFERYPGGAEGWDSPTPCAEPAEARAVVRPQALVRDARPSTGSGRTAIETVNERNPSPPEGGGAEDDEGALQL